MVILASVSGIMAEERIKKGFKVNKGEGSPRDNERDNENDDNMWLNMFDSDDFDKPKIPELGYGYEQQRKHIEDNYKDDVEFILRKVKKNPNFTMADAEAQIKERRLIYDRELDELKKQYDPLREWYDKAKVRSESSTSNQEYYDSLSGDLAGQAQSSQEDGLSDEYYPKEDWETARGYKDRLVRNENLTVISEIIPRIEDQPTKDYSDYISKICEQFPRETNEDVAVYRERIKLAYDVGDLQLAAARALIDPQSELDEVIKLLIVKIEGYEKELAQDPYMDPEQRKKKELQIREKKIQIYERAVRIERVEKQAEWRKGGRSEGLQTRGEVQNTENANVIDTEGHEDDSGSEEKRKRRGRLFRNLGRAALLLQLLRK